ncbi:MAG TPA: hypothetical protein VF214_11100 [Edaphobacter sp.]
MGSPSTKATIPTLKAPVPELGKNTHVSVTADYVYRIAALTAGIALLMTVV